MGWYSQALEQGARSLGMFAHEGNETWCVVGTSTMMAQYVCGPIATREEAAQIARQNGGTVLLMHPPRIREEDDDE